MSEIEEKRAMKKGVLTPLAVAQKALHKVEEGDTDLVLVVIKSKSGGIEVGYSTGSYLTMLGLAEVLKNDILHDLLQDL